MNARISHQIHPKAGYSPREFNNNKKKTISKSNFWAKKLFLWVCKLWLAVEISECLKWLMSVCFVWKRVTLLVYAYVRVISLRQWLWMSSPAYFTLFWCLAGLSSECFLLWAALKRNHNAIEVPRPLNHTLGWEVYFLLISRPVAISCCLTPCLSNRMPLLLASPRQCIIPAPRERPPCGRAT